MPATIKYGSQGQDVALAQQLLNGFGYSLAIDGIFGSETDAAMRDFQARAGLTVDGVAGDNTWAALNTPLTLSSTQGTQNTTGTVSPIPAGSSANLPATIKPNQLSPGLPASGAVSASTNWKLWGILLVLGLGVWWIIKNNEQQ